MSFLLQKDRIESKGLPMARRKTEPTKTIEQSDNPNFLSGKFVDSVYKAPLPSASGPIEEESLVLEDQDSESSLSHF